jgi:hypothetical protein
VRFFDDGIIKVGYTAKGRKKRLWKLISSFTGCPVLLKDLTDNMEDINTFIS